MEFSFESTTSIFWPVGLQTHKADTSPWTSVWTSQGRPSDLVLRRMVAFADAALKAMQRSLGYEHIWSEGYVAADYPASDLRPRL